jgi:hypothetical protein
MLNTSVYTSKSVFFVLFITFTSICAKNSHNLTQDFGSDVTILSSNELSCYSCLDPLNKSPECTCESSKCVIKAQHSMNPKIIERVCSKEKWAKELLYDGCLVYGNKYYCVCSSNYCNSGNLTSIRGHDDCSRSPCPKGALCLDTFEGFKCMCPPWQPSCTYRK